MAKKYDYTIQRGARIERTVVGITGMTHVYQDVDRKDRDGHFTDEGQYRRAIEKAVSENTR